MFTRVCIRVGNMLVEYKINSGKMGLQDMRI